ncbi:pilus assembly protein [Actinoplanes sp. CA-054009]
MVDAADDRGSATLELLILTPALLLTIAAAAIGMRIEIAGGAVEAASYDAARAASISRDADTAHTNALNSAQSTLAQQNLHCSPLTVTVDTSGFSIPVGQPANVVATVTCVVNLADITAAGMPGSKTMTSTSISPIDRYRARR